MKIMEEVNKFIVEYIKKVEVRFGREQADVLRRYWNKEND